MNEIEIKLVFGCLNCDKPIPLKEAKSGKQICSWGCMKELNKIGGHFDEEDVYGNEARLK